MPMATLISIWPCFQLQSFESKGPYYMNRVVLQNGSRPIDGYKSMNVGIYYHHIPWRD